MIKLSNLPGTRTFKSLREAFSHISSELTRIHEQSKKDFDKFKKGKVGHNVSVRR